MTTYYSSFYPLESADGAKGSAAFLGAISAATVSLYKRSATALTNLDKPNGSVIYTYTTGNINITAITNGWTVLIPSGNDPLYIVSLNVTGTDPTETILTAQWPTPVILAQNGTSTLVYDIVTSAPVIAKDAPNAGTSGTYSSITIQGKSYDGSITTNYGWATVTMNGDLEATTATNTAVTPITLTPANTSGASSYTIKLYNQATVAGATLLDTQTVSVVFKGATGSSGVSARAVSLASVTQGFAYDSSGATPSPISTVVTATALNTSGTVYYEFLVDGVSVQNTTTNTYTYTPRAFFVDMPDTIRVNVREGGIATTILASDGIVMSGLKNSVNGASGISALTVILSNNAHTLPTTNTGTVTYTGSGTTIRLYEGTAELTYDGVGTSNGTWKVVATGTGITPGTLTDSGTYLTVGEHSNMTANNASVSYTITGKRADGTAINLIYTQSLSKSIEGQDGIDAINLVLSNEAHVFPSSSSGIVSSYLGSGTTIRVYEGTAELLYAGGGAAGTWTVTATPTNITVGTIADSGAYATVGVHSGVATGIDTASILYTITGKNQAGTSFSLSKLQSFTKAKTGLDGLSSIVAETSGIPSPTIACTSDQTPKAGALAAAGGTMRLRSAATGLITSGVTSFVVQSNDSCLVSINSTTGVYTFSAIIAINASATFRCTYEGKDYTLRVPLTKVVDGTDSNEFTDSALFSSVSSTTYPVANAEQVDIEVIIPAGKTLTIASTMNYSANSQYTGGEGTFSYAFAGKMKITTQNMTDSGSEIDLTNTTGDLAIFYVYVGYNYGYTEDYPSSATINTTFTNSGTVSKFYIIRAYLAKSSGDSSGIGNVTLKGTL